jgi:anthranilate phosphoribosyltransferase
MKNMMKMLITGAPLTLEEAQTLMDAVISGEMNPEQIGFFLAAYEFRVPTGQELAGFAQSLLKKSISIGLDEDSLVDVCGTGGDGLSMFNVSTCVAFVVAASGMKVAKHGNRAVSSRCGSFDVLEALNFPIAHNGKEARVSIKNHGITFLFAPSFHPVLGVLSTIRRNLGVRTILNALGPLLNPAGVKRQLIGVYSPKLLVPMAEALNILGAEEAMIVHGEDGSDEISLTAPTMVAHLKAGVVTQYKISPEQFGMKTSSIGELAGGEAEENARILLQVLEGVQGAHRNITLLNASAALLVGGKARTLEEGIKIAANAIDSGMALKLIGLQNTPVVV